MPECTCRTICSSGEQPHSTSSLTWPYFCLQWCQTELFRSSTSNLPFWVGRGCTVSLFAEKWNRSHQVRQKAAHELPGSIQLGSSPQASLKVQTAKWKHPGWLLLSAKCPMSKHFSSIGWGPKWGPSWVPVDSERRMWYLWEMMALEANPFLTRLPGPGPTGPFRCSPGSHLLPVLALKRVPGEAQIKP